MEFLIFNFLDYKLVIKERTKDLKKTKPKYTLQYLSEILGIQYTFLSKILNSSSHHLNEDQVHIIGHTLEFLHDEIDYLILLRSYQSTLNPERKQYLYQKISNLQKNHILSVNAETINQNHFNDDISYLMDYHALVIHVALWIKPIQKKPEMLCQLLGMDFSKIKKILILLDRLGRITFDQKTNEIKNLQNTRIHFGKDHPLTRTHQLIMKTFLNQLSFTKDEDKKENLFMTFTTDKVGFEKMKEKIKEFTSEIQKISFDNSHQGVYQMNIDFLEIFNLK